MTFNQECKRIITLARSLGYKAINIDHAGPKVGQKAGGYEVSAQSPCNSVRVVIARQPSWKKCYSEAVNYLTPKTEDGKPLIEIP